MTTSLNPRNDRNTAFIRGVASLGDDVVTRAEDQLFLARRARDEHPNCPITRALERGAEEWLRQVCTVRGINVPDGIPDIAPEVISA